MEKELTQNIIFAERLKTAMNIRGVKQIDLITDLGINKGAMSSYLAGRYMPKNETIYRISKYLDVKPTWLIGIDVANSSSPVQLTSHEHELVLAYRSKPELQHAVDVLLGIEKRESGSFGTMAN
ncbi:MAG: helix-turn-helix domain-containing protein [Sphaerochaetaceae bacterium]